MLLVLCGFPRAYLILYGHHQDASDLQEHLHVIFMVLLHSRATVNAVVLVTVCGDLQTVPHLEDGFTELKPERERRRQTGPSSEGCSGHAPTWAYLSKLSLYLIKPSSFSRAYSTTSLWSSTPWFTPNGPWGKIPHKTIKSVDPLDLWSHVIIRKVKAICVISHPTGTRCILIVSTITLPTHPHIHLTSCTYLK